MSRMLRSSLRRVLLFLAQGESEFLVLPLSRIIKANQPALAWGNLMLGSRKSHLSQRCKSSFHFAYWPRRKTAVNVSLKSCVPFLPLVEYMQHFRVPFHKLLTPSVFLFHGILVLSGSTLILLITQQVTF